MKNRIFDKGILRVIEEKLVVVTFSTIFVLQAFNGALKYYFDRFHLLPIYYIPIALSIVYLFLSTLSDVLRAKTFKAFFYCLSLLVVFTLVGLLQINNVFQVIFGNYLLVLFLFGIRAYGIYLGNILFFTKLSKWLTILMVGGVVINYIFIFPWEGYTYSVGGVELYSSRDLVTYGIRRLAGFGASSFHTAACILVHAVISFLHMKRRVNRIMAWLAVFIALGLTTTKGVIVAFIVLTVALLLKDRSKPNMIKLLLVGSIAGGIILPFSLFFYDFSAVQTPNYVVNVLLTSFQMRLTDAWPNVIQLVENHGSLLLGRGIGGVGIAQSVFERALYCPGDNIWMYIYAMFGMIGVVIIAFFYLIKLCKLKLHEGSVNYLVIFFFIAMFSYGITFVTMQLTTFSILTGVFTAYLFVNKKYIQND